MCNFVNKIYSHEFMLFFCSRVKEPQCQKTYLQICVPSKDSRMLIRIFTGHILDSRGCKESSRGERTDQTARIRRLI